jgi:hypothetical protein
MADFSMNVNYPKAQATSLGDMVNMASGIQNYQQTQQMNPLLLQKAQQEVEQARQLNPLELEKKQIENQVLKQKNDERLKIQEFISNPDNWQTNGRTDMDKANKISVFAPLTGPGVISELTTLSKSQTDATKAKNAMTQDMRQVVAGRLGILGRMGIDDPKLIVGELDRLKNENPDSREVHDLIEAYKVPLAQAQRGPNVVKDLIAQEQSLLSPAQKESSLTPSISTTAQGQTILTQPSVAGSAPTATVGVAQGLQNTPQQGGGGMGQRPVVGNLPLPYPIRSASQPYAPEPTEAADQAAGQGYRTRLIEAQGGLPQSRRNVEEVIKQATGIGANLKFPSGGVLGQLEQRVLMAMKSDEYDMLAKDLANMALSNTKAMGGVGNTVAGLDMQAVANGTTKVPTGVLINIARRVQADQTNIDMQANGAQKFAQQYGDNNIKAYQQLWNANADTKIFEVMNLYKDITDPTKRKFEIEKLLGSDPAKRQEFYNKYQNIKKLSETGGL